MAKEEQKTEEKIDLTVALVAHLILGAGIYMFGKSLKNKKEEVFGLIFAIAFVSIFLYSQILPCHQVGEELIGEGCNWIGSFYIMAVLSWIYLIARFVQNRKRVKISLKSLGEAT